MATGLGEGKLNSELFTKTIQVRRTRLAGHYWRSRDKLISDVLRWTRSHGRAETGGPAWNTYSSSVRIRGVALGTCWKRWTIGRGGERGSGMSVLMARQEICVCMYVYIYIYIYIYIYTYIHIHTHTHTHTIMILLIGKLLPKSTWSWYKGIFAGQPILVHLWVAVHRRTSLLFYLYIYI